MKINYKKFLSNDLSIFILFFMIWFCLFRFTGSFTKGYNIYEDYLVITTSEQLSSNDLPSVTYDVIKQDIEIRARFRIFFCVYKVLSIKVFGDNFMLHTFFTLLLGVAASFFLYKFFFEAGFSKPQSLFFGILLFTGPQVIAWSDFSGSESFAVLFLSLALFFSMKSINTPHRKLMYNIFFIISLVFASLTKENFIFIIPAALYLYLWMYARKNHITLFVSLKKNYVVASVLLSVMIFLLLPVIFFVGINNQGYTGIDTNNLGPGTILKFIIHLFSYRIFIVILCGIFIILIYKFLLRKTKSGTESVKRVYFYFPNIIILFLLIVFPQYIIYIKSGLFGRYLLPFTIGLSIFLLFIIKNIFESKQIPSFVKYLYLTLVFVFTFFEIKDNTIAPLLEFADNCKSTTEIANSIAKNGDESLLFIFDPVQNFHEVNSFKIYLRHLSGERDYEYGFVKDSFIHPYFADVFSDSTLYKEYITNVIEEFGGKNLLDSITNKDEINNIFLFSRLRKDFLNQNKFWFDESKFAKKDFGRFTLYSKNSENSEN
jgi:hypothetical protein